MDTANLSPQDPARIIRRLRRLVFWTQLVLFWEDLWPRLWPILVLGSLLIASVLFDVLPNLAPLFHMAVLALTLSLAGLSLFLNLKTLNWPTRQQAISRLEMDNNLHHQPLNALLDQPASSTNAFTNRIWLNHQERMLAFAQNLIAPRPLSYLHRKDPYTLRAGLILLLILGLIEGRHDYKDRFMRALLPALILQENENWSAQIWITPPAYSGLGAALLSATAKDDHKGEIAINVLQHSTVLIRLEGITSQDKTYLSTGMREEKLQNLGQGNFSLETVFDQGNKITIRRGNRTLYSRNVNMTADLPPTISLKGTLHGGQRGHLRIGYESEDDFALKNVALIIRPFNQNDENAEHDIILSQPVQGQKVNGFFSRNLADHPWAGQKVVLTPRATDSFDQTSYGAAISAVLPQRRFEHPLAIRLIDIRKSLFDPSAQDRIFAVLELTSILDRPQDFGHEIPVYLALRVAHQRLRGQLDTNELATIRNILWETAVHLDEGRAGTARNLLEDMTRQMQDLLQNANDKGAMEALFEQMRKSLQDFMQRMAQDNSTLNDFKTDAQELGDAEFMGQEQLMEMLNQARELMRQGNREAAQALMKQFQSILSRLAMQPKTDPEQAAQAKKLLDELQNIRNQQQDLLEQTFSRTRKFETPSIQSTRQAIQEAETQKELLSRLRQKIQELNEKGLTPPNRLKDAAHNMEQAQKALERGLDENAIQSQSAALEALSEGLKQSAQSLARQMGMQPMPSTLPGRDPMGRSRQGTIQTEEGQNLPTEMEIRRSREILQELYRRSGQKARGEQELQYIERLIDRF